MTIYLYIAEMRFCRLLKPGFGFDPANGDQEGTLLIRILAKPNDANSVAIRTKTVLAR
jgi:hypothetical protein